MVADGPLNPAPLLRTWAPGVASATVPMHEGQPCGDVAAWLPAPASEGASPPSGLLAIIDGLGHGAEAALAADAALALLQAFPDVSQLPLGELLQRMDTALARLRGAAVGLVRVHGARLWHAGVGNTRAMRLRDQHMTRLPSQNGIVGGGLPHRLGVTELDLQAGDGLLLFTDGLDERLSVPLLLPEWRREPVLLCQHLLRQHRQGQDDAGVLVLCRGQT